MGPVAPGRISPIGVVGAGHSGTTIVYRMLAMHPDATWFSQYSYRALLGPRVLRAAAAGTERVLRALFPHDWKKAQSPQSWRRIVPTPIEAFKIWEVLLSADPAGQADRIRAVFARACAVSQHAAVVVKPPGRYRSRCAPVISSAFPLSRYVHVARDGRAVALSVFAKWLERAPQRRDTLLRRGADHWVRALRQVQQYETALPVELIQYEALCADVWGEVRRALEFAGLDPDRFPYTDCPRTLTSTNEARLLRAEPGDLAVLDRLLADDLRRYGYAVGRT